MTRKSATVLLSDMNCAGGTVHTVEVALLHVRGVSRAYVNPVTEAADVEYDAEQCAESDLITAVESVGVRALQPARPRAATAAPARRFLMANSNHSSRIWWAFAGFLAIAAFFLLEEHRAHMLGVLPYLFLLACPFMHLFMHRGHDEHAHHEAKEKVS